MALDLDPHGLPKEYAVVIEPKASIATKTIHLPDIDQGNSNILMIDHNLAELLSVVQLPAELDRPRYFQPALSHLRGGLDEMART